jgi:outer membrane protein assembly factor BamB
VDRSSPPAGKVSQAWSHPVDAAVYAEPLVIASTVIVATENDTVYALDASTGALKWSKHLGTPVAGSSLPCGNIDPSGITSTPVIDPATQTVWVVTFERPTHHQLYGLDLANGDVRSSRAADAPGSDPSVEQERGALTLANDTVYVPYGGLYGDCGDYLGRVVAFAHAGTGAEMTWKVSNEKRAGVWAPPGPTVASDGSLFVATGNGDSTDAYRDSDAVVRLSPTLTEEDSFAPASWARLNDEDLDLGTTSPALLSDGLVLEVGKEGIGYLLRSDHLGGVGGEVFSAQVCNSAYGGTAVSGSIVFVSCRDGLHKVTVTGAAKPSFTAVGAGNQQVGPPVLAGGLVWSVTRSGHLEGRNEASGDRTYDFDLGTLYTSFPSLAASAGRLFVPAGKAVVAFRGV